MSGASGIFGLRAGGFRYDLRASQHNSSVYRAVTVRSSHRKESYFHYSSFPGRERPQFKLARKSLGDVKRSLWTFGRRGNCAPRDPSTGKSYPAPGIFSLLLDRAPRSGTAPKCVARRETLSRVTAWRSLFTETAHRADKQRSQVRVRPACCPYPNASSVAPSRRSTRGNSGYKCSSAASTSRRHGKASVASSDRHHDSRMDFRYSPLQTPSRRISFSRSAGFPSRLPVRRNRCRPLTRQADSPPPSETCALVARPILAGFFTRAGKSLTLGLASAVLRWYPRAHQVRGKNQ